LQSVGHLHCVACFENIRGKNEKTNVAELWSERFEANAIKFFFYDLECHAAKGKQTCSLFGDTADICQLFYLAAKKCHNQ